MHKDPSNNTFKAGVTNSASSAAPNRRISPQIEELIRRSAISLVLEDFNDIFSDFDPRPYHDRSLSDDFLHEAQKVVRETKPGNFELHLLVPQATRQGETEEIIKKKLHEHFRREELIIRKNIRKNIQKGLWFLLVGFILMISNGYINYTNPTSFIWSMLQVCFEPASWFIVWNGFELILNSSKESKVDFEFHQKMAKADITFESY